MAQDLKKIERQIRSFVAFVLIQNSSLKAGSNQSESPTPATQNSPECDKWSHLKPLEAEVVEKVVSVNYISLHGAK